MVSLAIMLGVDNLTEEALQLASQQYAQSLQVRAFLPSYLLWRSITIATLPHLQDHQDQSSCLQTLLLLQSSWTLPPGPINEHFTSTGRSSSLPCLVHLQRITLMLVVSAQSLTLWSALPSGASCQLGLVPYCRNLVTLSLRQVAVAEPMDLGPVFQSCKQLEKVCISYEAFPTSPWVLRDGRGFRDSVAPVWQVGTDTDVEDLVSNCPVSKVSS